ncbi:MAG: MBL fold metallo-hydrolase [Synergistaceae bacterium]|nr:MBL fold metallo-hydrolase [Synergistaceae bacterium]
MKIKVLVDNNTLTGSYYTGEPGFSLWIECGGRNILFDCGYSDLFLRSARRMKLPAPDTIVLSHGHSDHTWGLFELIKEMSESGTTARPRLILHPEALGRKRLHGHEAGIIVERGALADYFDLRPTKEPLEIAEKLFWLGEIEPAVHPRKALGEKLSGGEWEPDYCVDDSALVYDGKDGLVIITGCSHSGICNIVEQARRLTGKRRLADIIGGFHLRSGSDEEMSPVISYLEKEPPARMHPCHCSCQRARLALAAKFESGEVGVGTELDFD